MPSKAASFFLTLGALLAVWAALLLGLLGPVLSPAVEDALPYVCRARLGLFFD